jgi:hypothetical protein
MRTIFQTWGDGECLSQCFLVSSFAKISDLMALFGLLCMCIQVSLLLFPATFPTSPASTGVYSSLTVSVFTVGQEQPFKYFDCSSLQDRSENFHLVIL